MMVILRYDIEQTVASLTKTLEVAKSRGGVSQLASSYIDGLMDGVRLVGICFGVDETKDEVPEVREEAD